MHETGINEKDFKTRMALMATIRRSEAVLETSKFDLKGIWKIMIIILETNPMGGSMSVQV